MRLHLPSDSLGETRTVAVIELKRGLDRADVDAADLAGLENAAQAEQFGRLVAGGEISGGRDHTTTIAARAREHVVVDVTAENGASASFQVDNRPSGAHGPRSDASISLRDNGLTAPRSLSRTGIVRVANRGGVEVKLRAGRYLLASLYNPLTAAGRPDILRGLIAVAKVR